ncbi:MAG: hypothetical protein WDN72_03535 [Alphaproteobacteria bacterium]
MTTPKKYYRDDKAHELGGTLGMTVGGVAAGIAAGAATGAAVSGPAAPVGAVIGAAIGGALGGKAGEAIAREINPTVEEQYWQGVFDTRDYVSPDADFETYRPAYRYGIDSYVEYQGRDFSEIEPELRSNWSERRGNSTLEWDDAREATREAYGRLYSNEDTTF